MAYVNSSLVLLYWNIGQKINEKILKDGRAEYGEQIIKQVAKQLTTFYGKGFNISSLSRMTNFAKAYPKQ